MNVQLALQHIDQGRWNDFERGLEQVENKDLLLVQLFVEINKKKWVKKHPDAIQNLSGIAPVRQHALYRRFTELAVNKMTPEMALQALTIACQNQDQTLGSQAVKKVKLTPDIEKAALRMVCERGLSQVAEDFVNTKGKVADLWNGQFKEETHALVITLIENDNIKELKALKEKGLLPADLDCVAIALAKGNHQLATTLFTYEYPGHKNYVHLPSLTGVVGKNLFKKDSQELVEEAIKRAKTLIDQSNLRQIKFMKDKIPKTFDCIGYALEKEKPGLALQLFEAKMPGSEHYQQSTDKLTVQRRKK